MPTESLEYRMTVEGVSDAISKLNAVKSALEGNTKATKEGTSAQGEASKASSDTALKLNQLGSTFGLVGQAVGRFNPQIGQMATAAGAATGVIQTLSTSALGPLGLTIGLVSAAAGVLAPAIAHMGEEADRAAERIRTNLNRSLTDFIADARAARENASLLERTRLGLGSSDEQTGRAGHARADIDARALELTRALGELGISGSGNQSDLERQLAIGARSSGGRAAQFQSALLSLRALNQATNTYEQSLRQVDEAERRETATLEEHTRKQKEEAAAAAARHAENHRASGAGGAQEGISEELLARQLINKENEFAIQQAQEENDIIAERIVKMREVREASESFDRARQNAIKHELEEIAHQQQAFRDSMGKAAGGDSKLAEAQKMMDQVRDSATGAAEAFASALGSSQGFGRALVASVDGYLLSLAKQETVKAIVETAEGFAALTNPFTAATAAGHFQSAGLHAAAAALAGAASAAIPNQGASAGGSSGARPEREPSSSGGSGGGTTIINFGGDVITAATHADLGRQIRAAMEAGDARLGRG